YIKAGSDEENYRLTSTGLSFRRLIAARVNKVHFLGAANAASDRIVEIWYRFTENQSDASPTWSTWYHSGDALYSGWFQWIANSAEPIYGADLTDFAMQFKFVVHSNSSTKSTFDIVELYINDEFVLGLDSYAQWVNNKDASSSGITVKNVDAGGYIEPTNYSSYGTYITTAASIKTDIAPQLDISKVMHTIHAGTVIFDGSSDKMIQTIWHNKHLPEERFEVKLEALEEQRWKSTFSTSANYFFQRYVNKIVDSSGISDAIEIGFYATEGIRSQNLGSADGTDDSGWKIIKNVTSISKISFDVYDWGMLQYFKEHVIHSYASPYTGKVLMRRVGDDIEICFDGDYSAEKTITVFGGVNIKNIIVWTEGINIPLQGTFRYEIQLQK
ncbi:MAG TPA: hypothetical protein PLQ59_09660, partial [Fervidobacterium sp.]|nr:hypothetical protein [Fervidobacterium sp.]